MTRALKLVSDPPRFSCGVTGEELKVRMMMMMMMVDNVDDDDVDVV